MVTGFEEPTSAFWGGSGQFHRLLSSFGRSPHRPTPSPTVSGRQGGRGPYPSTEDSVSPLFLKRVEDGPNFLP